MRAPLVVLLLLVPLAAGCLGDSETPAATSSATPLVLAEPPEGALVEPGEEGGLVLKWPEVDLPFEVEVPIPAGTTLVRASALAGEDDRLSVSMRHSETDRRRCNFGAQEAWDVRRTGRATCTGVTAVDRLPDSWIVRAAGAAVGDVQVELLTTPYDGLLAQLDLSQLSLREHELEPTREERVASFDGTPLHVEVTLPKGDGPWPTILWSSPYNDADRLSGEPAAWRYFVRDWAERGYAVVSADVRGFGESGGCVEVWGLNERKDQAFLVEWVARQDWSDGRVGFYGQSYVGTTPVEAAVQAPEALKAIVVVAPVNDAYNDWHFGGVPNGENALSPVGYQRTGTSARRDPGDPLMSALNAANGLCDPTLALRASDPRAVYDAFYVERNLSALAGDVEAAVLYTQGFEDSNVKSRMVVDFFNALEAPKLGLFGHWLHQHPARADNEVLMLGWMDQHVKGKPVGFGKLAPVHVVTNAGTHRSDDAWPPLAPTLRSFGADLDAGTLAAEGGGSAELLLDPIHTGGGRLPVAPAEALPWSRLLVLSSDPLAEPLHVAGEAGVRLAGALRHAENGHVAARLYERAGDERRLVTWGMLNLAHRHGHDRHEPVAPGESLQAFLPLLPTEWVFPAGVALELELRGVRVHDWVLAGPGEPAVLELDGAGTSLVLPTVDPAQAQPLPVTAQR